MKQQDTPSSAASSSDDDRKTEIERDIAHTGIALSTSETVSRFGSANAIFLDGYSGRDEPIFDKNGLPKINKETGVPKTRAIKLGLKRISTYNENGIEQQKGLAAEVAVTSRENAEAIINKSPIRSIRSDELQEYGKNHTVVDRVQILDGKIIEGSQSQMKFVGNPDQLLDDIAREDGKYARYRGTQIELPSEQYEDAVSHCRQEAQQRRFNADKAEQAGRPGAAAKLRLEAENYEQLAQNVRDSGLTTEEAIFYRKHPKLATAKDIARTSHRAGMEGAKYGAIIGGCISSLQNAFAVAQGKKEIGEAIKDSALGTAQAGAIGYGTAFVGAGIKGAMQQSSGQALRTLANTNAPALAVNVCLSLGSSVKRYVSGDISEAQLLTEVGEKGAGMLASSMMAALGQLAIPVPFVGAAVGGMIGYTLSSLFYQSALDAARGAEASHELLERTRAIESAARARIAEEQAALDDFIRREMPELQQETQRLFAAMDATGVDQADALAAAINQYATLLGKRLQFQSLAEFEIFMESNQPLRL